MNAIVLVFGLLPKKITPSDYDNDDDDDDDDDDDGRNFSLTFKIL